jgi:hypothetical protein
VPCPAGTEFQTFDDLFTQNPAAQLLPYATEECAIAVPYSDDVLAKPPPLDYPTVPPNWESAAQIAANKPSTQTFARLFQQLAFGGASDDPNQTAFTLIPYPTPPGQYNVGIAPYSYWQRSLDSYTQIMNIVDGHIGAVVDALPPPSLTTLSSCSLPIMATMPARTASSPARRAPATKRSGRCR